MKKYTLEEVTQCLKCCGKVYTQSLCYWIEHDRLYYAGIKSPSFPRLTMEHRRGTVEESVSSLYDTGGIISIEWGKVLKSEINELINE